jgi:hypothetical protein
MSIRFIALSAALVCTVSLAALSLPGATQDRPDAEASPDNTDDAAFSRGAKAWADNCSRCHAMRDPKDLTDEQWKVVVTHMRLRAGIDGAQADDIRFFLQRSN